MRVRVGVRVRRQGIRGAWLILRRIASLPELSVRNEPAPNAAHLVRDRGRGRGRGRVMLGLGVGLGVGVA